MERIIKLVFVLILLSTPCFAQEDSILNLKWNNTIGSAIELWWLYRGEEIRSPELSNILQLKVADIDNDNFEEVVIITGASARPTSGGSITKERNKIIVYRSNGTVMWEYKVDDQIRQALMYDINNDMQEEFILSSGDTLNNIQRGTIRILDNKGKLLRSYDSTSLMQSLYLTDINDDRYYEILGGSTLRVILFQIYGEKVWMYPSQGHGTLPAPADVVSAGDVDGDGKVEMVIGSDKIYYLDKDGTYIHDYDVSPSENPLNKGFKYLKVFKVGASGLPDVVSITKKNVFNAVRLVKPRLGGTTKDYPEINVTWSLDLNTNINDIKEIDIDGDGYPEFIIGGSNGRVYAVDNTGQVLWEYPVNGGVGGISLGDVDNDNITDILAGTYAGTIYALDLGGNFKWKQDTPKPVLGIGVGDLDANDITDIVVVKEKNIVEAYELNKTYVLRKRGDNYFNLGQEYFITSKYAKARDYFVLAKETFLAVGYERGISDSERLIKQCDEGLTENRRADASLYYSKATEYFATADYESSLAFTKKAKEIFQELGDSEMVLKCELLEIRIKNANTPQTIPSTTNYIGATTTLGSGVIGVDVRILTGAGVVLIIIIVAIAVRKKQANKDELIGDTLEKTEDL